MYVGSNSPQTKYTAFFNISLYKNISEIFKYPFSEFHNDTIFFLPRSNQNGIRKTLHLSQFVSLPNCAHECYCHNAKKHSLLSNQLDYNFWGATCNLVDGKCKCKPGYAGQRPLPWRILWRRMLQTLSIWIWKMSLSSYTWLCFSTEMRRWDLKMLIAWH